MTALTIHWRCYYCTESGTGPSSNAAAEKHTKQHGHATCTWTTTKEGGE